MDQLFEDLMKECEISAPGARLSISIRNRLEEHQINVRKDIVSRVKDDCSALFIACESGQVETVEYLITVCNADIEQRGLFKVFGLFNTESVSCVTPLWCAAVAGKLPVVKCLISHGAEINAVSDDGSTPVRSTCSTSRLDIVEYLIANGADISKPNYDGETCLMNSVESVELCSLLLRHGVNVNASDSMHETALHHAIQENRFETVKLLLDHDADPHSMSNSNNDALRTACICSETQIFNYLVDTIPYSPERLADAYELVGSTYLNTLSDRDDDDNTQTVLEYWRKAIKIRIENGVDDQPLLKRPSIPRRDCFRNAVEFSTLDELNLIARDLDAIHIQSLLICERILGEYNLKTYFQILASGSFYYRTRRYQNCIDLWRRLLELGVHKDFILNIRNICPNARNLVQLMVDLNRLPDGSAGKVEPRFYDVVAIFKLLTSQLVEIRPVHKRNLDLNDCIFKCVIYLIYLLVETAQTVEQQREARELVRNLVERNPQSASTEDTLLHLCSSRLDQLTTSFLELDDAEAVFPHVEVVKLLLDCGADVNARNGSGSTPLHVASNANNFNSHLIKLLLDLGAHIDTPNLEGDTPQRLISSNPQNSINLVNYMTLRCYAAQAIVKYGLQYHELPTTFHKILELHKV